MLIKQIRYIVYFSLMMVVSAQAGWFDDKIKVRKCYDPKSYDNFEQYHEFEVDSRIQGDPFAMTKWDWDLDLKNKKALRITEVGGKLMMKELNLLDSDNFVIVNYSDGSNVVFDKKKETVKTSAATFQCVFK